MLISDDVEDNDGDPPSGNEEMKISARSIVDQSNVGEGSSSKMKNSRLALAYYIIIPKHNY